MRLYQFFVCSSTDVVVIRKNLETNRHVLESFVFLICFLQFFFAVFVFACELSVCVHIRAFMAQRCRYSVGV